MKQIDAIKFKWVNSKLLIIAVIKKIPDATLTLTLTVINSKLVPSKNIREVEKIKKSTKPKIILLSLSLKI